MKHLVKIVMKYIGMNLDKLITPNYTERTYNIIGIACTFAKSLFDRALEEIFKFAPAILQDIQGRWHITPRLH
jgi:ferritin-like protein